MTRVSTYVEVDLSDFDDEEVIRYAQGLAGYREDNANTVRDLAIAIEAGDKFTALVMLDRLVGDSLTLREVANVARCGRIAA